MEYGIRGWKIREEGKDRRAVLIKRSEESILNQDRRFVAKVYCPRCGGRLRQAKKGERLDQEGSSWPIRHIWYCTGECKNAYYSIEWRPIGVADCCEDMFRKPMYARKQSTWEYLSPSILNRPLTVICPTCARTYHWREQLALTEEAG